LLVLFSDESSGAFHMTGHDAEALIARPADIQDGALPSANSMAATALLRLAGLTGDRRYHERAEDVIASMAAVVGRVPLAFTGMVAAGELARTGMSEIVVTGERPDLVRLVQERYLPAAVLAWGEPWESPLWEGRTGADQSGRAFVCRNYACQAPVTEATVLASQLDSATN
jgi:hypothetical protein